MPDRASLASAPPVTISFTQRYYGKKKCLTTLQFMSIYFCVRATHC